MPLVTHFRSPEGDLLPIAAAAQYTVEIPAAGSEDLKGWLPERDVYMRRIMLEGVTEEMAVHVSCPVGAIFTEHGLYVTQDVGVESFIDLELSSLPAAATSVHLLVQHAEGGGAVYMPVVGQSGGAANIITANSKDELPDPSTVPEGTIALVPSAEGVTLTSPNGTVYRLTVSDDGTLAATAV